MEKQPEHPIQKAKFLRIVGGPHGAQTKFLDRDGNDITRDLGVMNAIISIDVSERSGHLWKAELTVCPIEFDIEAKVTKRTMHCFKCKQDTLLD